MAEWNEDQARFLRALGLTIAARREELGIRTVDFTEHCGFHRTYLRSIERGERNATALTLECVADLLEWRVSELFRRAGY